MPIISGKRRFSNSYLNSYLSSFLLAIISHWRYNRIISFTASENLGKERSLADIMQKIVYHGSVSVIEKPEYGKGSRQNDYGRGFYCTESQELAREWACAKNTDGYANKYELDFSGLKVLDLNDPEYSILNWLAILTKNRTYWQNSSIAEEAKRYLQQHFYINTAEYDIIIGYRADDSYFSFAQDFVANGISLQQISEAMHLGKPGEQIVLISRKSFSSIRFL